MSTSASVAATRQFGKAFYALIGLACLTIAVLGFLPTYFVPLVSGSFAAPPVVHIHAVLAFGWTLFFCMQAWLVWSGRMLSHRTWGLAGISLATAMVISVFVAAGAMIHLRTAAGFGEQALAFSWVQVGGMLFFAGAFGWAIARNHRPHEHKRLLVLATVSLLDAPLARLVLIFGGMEMPQGVPPPPPVSAIFPASLLADLLIVAAIVFDWRTMGRPHRVYLIGGAVLLLFQATRSLVAASPAWAEVASVLSRLAG